MHRLQWPNMFFSATKMPFLLPLILSEWFIKWRLALLELDITIEPIKALKKDTLLNFKVSR